MPDVVSVRYVGKNMVPLGGTMILSGEVRHNVPRYQVREALRHNPGKFVILDDVIRGEPVPDGAVIVDTGGDVIEVRGHFHEHAGVSANADPGEILVVPSDLPSDEPVTVLSEESHVDQPEQPSKPPAKRRSRKK